MNPRPKKRPRINHEQVQYSSLEYQNDLGRQRYSKREPYDGRWPSNKHGQFGNKKNLVKSDPVVHYISPTASTEAK